MDNRLFLDSIYHGFSILIRPSDGFVFVDRNGVRMAGAFNTDDARSLIEKLVSIHAPARVATTLELKG